MTLFSELNIEPTERGFVGNKVEVNDVLNEKIIVHEFRVKDSKYPKNGNDKCLHLQIEKDGNKKVLFVPSRSLIDVIMKVPEDKFPFETTIKKNHKRLEFT